MLGALLYLRFASLRGRVLASARRLRQPKYFVSFLVGAAYVYYFFLRRPAFAHRGRAAYADFGLDVNPRVLVVLGSALLLVVLFANAIYYWTSATPEARLRFSEAEIAFLFPAPLTRARLIHFHLLSSQFTILISSVFLTLIMDRWSFLPGNVATHAIGWWLILSVVRLFGSAMNFSAARVMGRFGPGARRRGLLLLALVALALADSLWTRARPPTHGESSTLAAMASYAAAWLQAGIGPAVLLPFEWVIRPFAADTLREFLMALVPALAIAAALYVWVLRLEVPFAEASIAGAEKRAQLKAVRRIAGRDAGPRAGYKARRPPFRLAATGRVEAAFFWKNLIQIQSWFNLRIALVLLVLGSCFVANVHGGPRGSGASGYGPVALFAAGFLAFYTMLLGPQLVRQDLRSDLQNADMLKTYPLPGWQIVLGEMLTPLLVLSGILWVAALAAGWALFAGTGLASGYPPAARIAFLACVALAIPPVVCLQLIVPNGAALLFPAWHQSTRARGGGIEVIGQRLIFVFGQLLAVLLALVPAALSALAIFVASKWWVGLVAGPGISAAVALLLATLAVLVIVGGEIWVGLWWLGSRFERLDIATELRP